MKSFTAVAFVALALFAFVSSKTLESKHADKDFLIKQKFMLEIFQHIYQDDVFVTKFDESFLTYKPWEHKEDFNNIEKFDYFFELWHHKPMYDDEIFSVFYDRHREYAHYLTGLFYHAKDWKSFQHVLFWARMHVNKQLFIYSATIATLARKDLEGIVLPAIYEIHPWHFFDVDTVELAEKYRMHGFHNVKKLDDIYNVVIRTNYSNVYGDVNYDHNLAYFLEDVGLNSFYYYYNLDYPYWTMGDEHHALNKDRRGEFYLYTHWQLLARYYMERLSNDLGEVDQFNMYEQVPSGYYPNLHYYRGVSFPDRENYHNFYYGDNIEYMRLIELYTGRVMDYIHKNTDFTIEALNKLGNIIQGNVDSENTKWFGSLEHTYRHIVNEGRVYGKYHEVLPNTFMHYETTIRDPLFFEIAKDLVHFYWHMVDTFPEYTKKDFIFDGVKINNVHMPESLTTYFEYFDSDISNVANVEKIESGGDTLVQFGRNSHHDGNSFVIKARQHRLNHKPFEFTLDVASDKAQKAVVKIYIGPKYDENGKLLHLEHNHKNFFELDHFTIDLVAGNNVIKRNSDDYSWWVNDRTTYLELYRKVMDATNSDYKFPLDQSEAHCGVPNRLMLPKGKKGGQTFQFFFMVYPYHEPAVKQFTGFDPIISCGIGTGARFADNMPFGFPFNRPVKHAYYFDVDNFKFHDVKIFHKDETTNVV